MAKNIHIDNHLFYIILLCLTFLCISSISFTRYHVPGWDESVYIGMGKYIYSAGNSGLWEQIRPLGLPLITGILWAMHTDYLLFSEIIAIAFSLGLIIATYALACRLFNKNVALIAALLLAITPIFLVNSTMVMTEIPSTLFAVLAFYFFIDDRFIFAGLLCGIAFLFRFPQGLMFIVLFSMMAYKIFSNKILSHKLVSNRRSKPQTLSIKKISYLSIAFIIIILPYFIFNIISYHNYHTNIIDAAIQPLIAASAQQNNAMQGIATQSLGNIASSVYNPMYYFIIALLNNPFLLLSIMGIIYIILDNRFGTSIASDNKKSSISIRKFPIMKRYGIYSMAVVLIIYLLYLSFITIKQERFILMMLPFICIISAYIIDHILDFYGKKNIAMHLLSAITVSLLIMMIFYNTGAYSNYLASEPEARPQIVSTLYRFFDSNNIEGPILTTDPAFVSYSDKRYIPYYDTVGKSHYLNPWESNIRYDAAIFSEESFPCLQNDRSCLLDRKSILENFTIHYQMAMNNTFTTDYQNYPVYVFLK